jgi:hypothetical protein
MSDPTKQTTHEFPVIVIVNGVRVEVVLKLKSTTVVAGVTATTDRPGATLTVEKPRDGH